MYLVTLCSCGNPDFGQNPKRPQSPPQVAVANSFGEASRACREYIEAHNLGGGNWSRKAGTIKDQNTGRVVGRVAYNGRVFGPEAVPGDWRSAPLLYQPDGGLPHLHD